MEKSQKYPDVILLNQEGTGMDMIMDTYTAGYIELSHRFHDLFKHDLKNYQNAIFMALELYQLKKEEKYLSMIEEASQKSLEYMEIIKKIEPYIFSGGGVGFYSFYASVDRVISKYPDTKIKVNGDDICIFADSAFPKLFDLMLQTAPENNEKYKIIFTTSEFQEDGLNKCNVKIEIHNSSFSGNALESILNEETNTITGDIVALAFYISKMTHARYSGNLKLTESTKDKIVITATFLSADNSIFRSFSGTFG